MRIFLYMLVTIPPLLHRANTLILSETGLTWWLLPVDKKDIPSSFYTGASYLRGLTRDYKDKDAFGIEAGFRWMIWKGLNLRIGVIAVTAKGQDLKINPTPGISYSFKF